MKRIRLASMFLITSLLIGCGSNPMALIYENDSKIASQGNSYNYYENIEVNVDNSLYTASVHGMDGMDTLWEYDANEDSEIQVDFDLKHQVGDVKLVLISSEGNLETIFESTEEEAIEGTKNLEVKEGDNRIKVVARDKAEFDLSISINKGDYEKLGF